MWNLIVSVPDHCLSFHFEVFNVGCGPRSIFIPTRSIKLQALISTEGRN